MAVAEPLARMPPRELIVVATVADGDALSAIAAELDTSAPRSHAVDVTARTAAFTSLTPGADVARLAQEQDVDLVGSGRARRAARGGADVLDCWGGAV